MYVDDLHFVKACLDGLSIMILMFFHDRFHLNSHFLSILSHFLIIFEWFDRDLQVFPAILDEFFSHGLEDDDSIETGIVFGIWVIKSLGGSWDDQIGLWFIILLPFFDGILFDEGNTGLEVLSIDEIGLGDKWLDENELEVLRGHVTGGLFFILIKFISSNGVFLFYSFNSPINCAQLSDELVDHLLQVPSFGIRSLVPLEISDIVFDFNDLAISLFYLFIILVLQIFIDFS